MNTAADTLRADASKLHYLIVEDDMFTRNLIKSALQAYGLRNIREASSAVQGFRIIKSEPVDVVLTDYDMVPLSGIDLVRLVRNDPGVPDPQLPIIMISGHAEPAVIREAKDAGVSEYLVRPISAEKIFRRIESVLRRPKGNPGEPPPRALRLTNVGVVLADSSERITRGLRTFLASQGYQRIALIADVPTLTRAFESNATDVVIVNVDLPGGDLAAMVSDLRHGRLGLHPFPVIIGYSLVEADFASESLLRAGCDDILSKPFTLSHLQERIMGIMRGGREPFIVSADYIGPRRSGIANAHPEPVDVPNVIKAKAAGNADSVVYRSEMEAAIALIDERRVICDADLAATVIRRVLPRLAAGAQDDDAPADLALLVRVSRDMAERIKKTRHARLADLCQSLAALSEGLRTTLTAPDPGVLAELPQLMAGIQRVLKA